jgi:hypothetical protein
LQSLAGPSRDSYANAINGLGAIVTTVVLAIVVYEKFFGGAYLVVILIPLLVAIQLLAARRRKRQAARFRVFECERDAAADSIFISLAAYAEIGTRTIII